MKIVFISDTHGLHNEIEIPNGDMLIHAGDISSRGKEHEIDDFLDWFSNQPHKYKIFIAGNHDFFFEKMNAKYIETKIPKNIIYLNDSGIEIENFKIWGSPIQPEFYDWAFNRNRGSAIKKHWDLIPLNTDLLITHGPPLNILDKTISGDFVGCEDLLTAVNRIKPKIHVFGHIHEDYGVLKTNNTTFINASVLDVRYRNANNPIMIEF